MFTLKLIIHDLAHAKGVSDRYGCTDTLVHPEDILLYQADDIRLYKQRISNPCELDTLLHPNVDMDVTLVGASMLLGSLLSDDVPETPYHVEVGVYELTHGTATRRIIACYANGYVVNDQNCTVQRCILSEFSRLLD